MIRLPRAFRRKFGTATHSHAIDLADAERLTLAIQRGKMIAAETDTQLRYLWVVNPHSDFNSVEVLGKRDDELGTDEGIAKLVELKKRVLETGFASVETISFRGSDGDHIYEIAAEPIQDSLGSISGVRTVAVDVTQRARAEAEVRHRDQQRSAFLDSLAHEVRNATHVAVLALQRAEIDPDALGPSLTIARRQLMQLERLAEDLVDAARMTPGSLNLRKRSVDLLKLVRQALDDCVAEADSSRLTLVSDLPPTPVEIEADPDRLLQVLQNLLSNAIKYTPSGGHIKVTVTGEIVSPSGSMQRPEHWAGPVLVPSSPRCVSTRAGDAGTRPSRRACDRAYRG